MSAPRCSSLSLLTVCLVLATGCVLGQNIRLDADFGLDELNKEPSVPIGKIEKHSRLPKRHPNGNPNVKDGTQGFAVDSANADDSRPTRLGKIHVNANSILGEEIRDDIDLGLRHHRSRKGNRNPIGEADITNDVDLGLDHGSLKKEPFDPNHVKDDKNDDLNHENKLVPLTDRDLDFCLKHANSKNFVSDNDVKDDVDLGLKHYRKAAPITDEVLKTDIDFGLKHEDSRNFAPSDNDIKDDLDLGLQHHRKFAPITNGALKKNPTFGVKRRNNKEEPNIDNDIKDDADLGLKPSDKTESITDDDINDDLDLGLKHGTRVGPISDKDISNDIDLGLKRHSNQHIPKLKGDDLHEQRREEKMSLLMNRRGMTAKEVLDAYKKNGIDLGQKRVIKTQRRNSTHPAVHVSHLRQKELHRTNEEKKFLSKKFNPVVDSIRRHRKQEMLEQHQQQQEKSGVSENVHQDNLCHQYDVDGCSIPFGLPFPFKELFTNSCYRHDICYGCGVQYGFDRKSCDYAFKANMWNTCLTKYGNGRENATNPRKRLIVNIVDDLKPKYNDILRTALGPVLTPSVTPEKDLEKLHEHAQFIQRGVITEWVALLRYELYLKKSFSSSRRERYIDLMYSRSRLHSKNESKMSIQFDNNLTNNLCEDILYKPKNDLISRRVELSCKEIELLTCYFFDYVYFLAVRIFAPFNYHATPEYYCSQPFVKKCLPRK